MTDPAIIERLDRIIELLEKRPAPLPIAPLSPPDFLQFSGLPDGWGVRFPRRYPMGYSNVVQYPQLRGES